MPVNTENKVLTPEQTESNKQEILDIFAKHVHRDGVEKLLDYLVNKSDFFTAPASTHLSARVCALSFRPIGL